MKPARKILESGIFTPITCNDDNACTADTCDPASGEKIVSAIPGADQLTEGVEYYSVRLQNSQEMFTLQKRYTFSLNTSIGVVTRTIDHGSLHKDSSSSANSRNGQPFIRDKNILLSLEIKF